MNPAERLRLEAIADGTRFAPRPTAEDIRALLNEIVRLEFAIECLTDQAAEEAFRQTLRRRPSC